MQICSARHKFGVQKHISSLKVDLSCGASPRRAQKHKYWQIQKWSLHYSCFHFAHIAPQHTPWALGLRRRRLCAVPLKNNWEQGDVRFIDFAALNSLALPQSSSSSETQPSNDDDLWTRSLSVSLSLARRECSFSSSSAERSSQPGIQLFYKRFTLLVYLLCAKNETRKFTGAESRRLYREGKFRSHCASHCKSRES